METIIIFVFLLFNLNIYSFSPIQETVNGLDWDVVVETSNGKVRGDLQTSQLLNISFYAFQSIPYAEPPIGDRRFKDPSAITNWTGILDATKMPKICPQLNIAENEMSEDCLFLNIFIPSPKPTNLLPVLFWIHGGFFQWGTGSMTNNRPDLLINEDVILVSINYRLGIFGYLSTEDDILPGNYATKDQIMALEWVHKNIANFGGDPSKITLMGQSAGAVHVGLLLQTPLAEGLFSAAILESGNSLNLWSRTRNTKSIAKEVANFFNIKYNTSQDLMDGLQKLKWTELLVDSTASFFIDAALSNPINGFTLGPTSETSRNGVVTVKQHEKLRTGDFNRVPVLTGFNSGEANMLLPIYNLVPLYLTLYDIAPNKLVPIDMNAYSGQLDDIGKKVHNFYFGDKSMAASKQLFADFLSDHEFIRPANEFARLVSGYTDTYFYRFSYVGQLPTVNGFERELPGAVHTEELQYLFYSPNENHPTAADTTTRKRMVKLWTNFAKYHNPTPSVDPLLQNVIWKPVQANQINYLDIDTDLQMLKNPSETNINFWKKIYGTYGNPPYDTY